MTKKRNIISVSILIIVWILFITTVKLSQDELYAENTKTNKQVPTATPYIEENDTNIVKFILVTGWTMMNMSYLQNVWRRKPGQKY